MMRLLGLAVALLATHTALAGPLAARDAPGVSGSSASTSGAISGSALTLASPLGFADGQGIRINHAGAAFSAATPGALTVSPQGGTGAAAYAYTVACLDGRGGVGAALAPVAIANGKAALGPTAYNYLTWSGAAGCAGYAVYRSIGGVQTLIGYSAGTGWNDFGATAITPPDWLPATAQAIPLTDWLVTTIVSGGGTTSLVLADAAASPMGAALVTHSDTAALQEWASDCSPVGCFLDPGTYQIEAPITISLATTISGAGRALATIAQVNPFADALRVVLASGQAPTLRDFAIRGQPNTNAGNLLYLSAASGEAYAAIVDHLALYNGGYGIAFGAASQVRITHSDIKGQSAAGIYVANSNNADSGDSTIAENFISTGFGALADIYYVSSGGLRIVNNKLLSQPTTQYGILFAQTAGTSSADLFVIGNSIEGQSIAAIWMQNGSGAVWSNVLIQSNQWAGQAYGIYSLGSAAGWPTNLLISGNIGQINGARCIYVYRAANGNLSNNVCSGKNLSGSVGIEAGSTVANTTVVSNTISGFATSVVR